MKRYIACVSAALLALGLSGCAQDADKSSSDAGKQDGKITVYATTNVWGSVAKHIGKDLIKVEEGVTNADQDPHGYESTAQDKLKVSQSQIVMVNGGGYDDWGSQLAKSVDSHPEIIDAVEVSGLEHGEDADHDEHADEHHDDTHGEDADHHDEADHHNEADHHDDEESEHAGEHKEEHQEGGHHHHHHHHGGFNEHVFYSLDTVEKVGNTLAEKLEKLDAQNADAYKKNAQEFAQKIDAIKEKADKHKEAVEHVHVLATEPVVGYLLEEMGMHDITPQEYVEQSETEAGPSAKTMAETKALITDGTVRGLILNGQTQDAVSDQLKKEAQEHNVAIVTVYESFPKGTDDIVTWLDNAVDALSAIK